MILFARPLVPDNSPFFQHDAWHKASRTRSLFAESSPPILQDA